MLPHRTWPPLLAGALMAAALHAADDRDRAREQARGDYTVRGGPTGKAAQDLKPPLQTGEVKVPQGGVDTSGFDANAGEGFKGQSTGGGGIIAPRQPAQGGTQGVPLSGATAPRGPRDAGPAASARGERGAGRDGADSAGARTGGGNDSAGTSTRGKP